VSVRLYSLAVRRCLVYDALTFVLHPATHATGAGAAAAAAAADVRRGGIVQQRTRSCAGDEPQETGVCWTMAVLL
jgi:hypothetical protein